MRLDTGVAIVIAGLMVSGASLYSSKLDREISVCNIMRQGFAAREGALALTRPSSTLAKAISKSGPVYGYDPAACGMLQFDTPTEASVQRLRERPELATQFDEKFGLGASKRYLDEGTSNGASAHSSP